MATFFLEPIATDSTLTVAGMLLVAGYWFKGALRESNRFHVC
jgi:hypothetical protein